MWQLLFCLIDRELLKISQSWGIIIKPVESLYEPKPINNSNDGGAAFARPPMVSMVCLALARKGS